MSWLWTSLFLVCFGSTAFLYFGYPMVLWMVGRLRPRPVRRGPARPRISVIVPVFNEERVVRPKLESLLAQRYPRDLMEILVVSDGSTDRTEDIVRSFGDDRIELVKRPRQGKVAALNEGVARAKGDVVALTDANAILKADALALLAESFADPEVGAVSAVQTYAAAGAGDSTAGGEGAYWRYDTWLKRLESTIGSMFAADGSLYCLRRALYVPITDPAQADDIAVSTRVVLQGFRLVLDERAVVVEEAPAESTQEFRRKVRVTIHSVRALLNLGRDLWFSGFYSFELLFHKLFRHYVPVLLIGMFLSSAILAGSSPLMLWLTLAQLSFYFLALLGFLLRRHPAGSWRLFSVPHFFVLVNGAALFGIVQLALGARPATWTPRSGHS